MAIAATLIGGTLGFISFLVAFLVLDFSFLSACVLYVAVGLGTVALAIASACLKLPPRKTETRTA